MTLRFLVSGRVQGVGFRYFVYRLAAGLGVGGWVKNLSDGRVEVVADGRPGDLDRFESAIALGPPHSQVSGVEKSKISDEVDIRKSFEIR